MARRTASWPVWLRRFSQTVFMLLFLYLFLQAVYHPVNQTGNYTKLFFQLDPLVLISSWLSSHQILSGLLLSFITLVITILAGRWFCGWFCPFGTLQNLFTGWQNKRAKERLAVGSYSRWQKSKYYALAAMLVAALLGLNLTGWLDPFSFFYRSLAVVVYPSINDGLKSMFGWIYQVDPGVGKFKLTAITEPIYDVLKKTVVATSQPYFEATVLIAILFFGIIFLNFYRARFWCRYICPLGALLGIAGKNPLVRIQRSEATCNDCRLCVADCQGGANPDVADGWKPAECFYCWNCHSACPQNAISFTVQLPGGKK